VLPFLELVLPNAATSPSARESLSTRMLKRHLSKKSSLRSLPSRSNLLSKLKLSLRLWSLKSLSPFKRRLLPLRRHLLRKLTPLLSRKHPPRKRRRNRARESTLAR